MLIWALAALITAMSMASCGAANRQASRTGPVTTGTRATGIPPALLRGARPIGRGPRFTPTLEGEPSGGCSGHLGSRRQAHVEVFAQNRVVLLAAGIGTRAPRAFNDGRLSSAACFGNAVTLDPTGTVYFRAGTAVTLADLFAEWGQPLARRRIATFTGGSVRVYVDGRARHGTPGSLALTDDAEIVLEIGPYVPPHSSFTFPGSPSPRLS
jgi:hypothetical protein